MKKTFIFLEIPGWSQDDKCGDSFPLLFNISLRYYIGFLSP